MAAPKKPKAAGVQKGKTKVAAAKSPAATVVAEKTRTADATASPGATISPATNGNGYGAPTAEMIRARAYEIFMARDGRSGDELSDWLAAEREIMGTLSSHS